MEVGLVKGKQLSVDGTFVEANAATESRVPREQLAEAAQVHQTAHQYLKEVKEQNPMEEPVHGQDQVSTTDPDSTYATKGGTPARLGYYNNYWWTRMSNVDRARTSGMEGTLNLRFGDHWRWRTSATRVKEARNLTTGENLIDTPEYSAYSALDWTPDAIFSSTLSAQYTGKQSGIASSFIKAYTLYDLTAAWNVNDVLTLRGGISNLLDKKLYAEGATDYFVAGRSVFFSVTARF